MKSDKLRYTTIIVILFFIIVSCNKKKNDDVVEELEETVLVEEFGFVLNDYEVIRDTIHQGDTFGRILSDLNMSASRVHQITEKVKDSFSIGMIKVGRPYTLLKSKDLLNDLKVFIYQPNNINYYVVDLRDTIVAYKNKKPITVKRKTIVAEINSSLSLALSDEGVDYSLAHQLSQIYAWSVDFFKIQKGDKFAVTFNEKYINDTIFVGIDNIEASFFEHKGKYIYAFPFVQDTTTGKVDYYDEQGKTLKNLFLKAPLKFSRITSRFSNRRFHPVQQTWKAHKGTDYAAPQGAEIMTTASGVVERTGYTAGNGNYVKVKHNSIYSTQYLHMSKILVKQGQHVKQGDIIGRVGSTGLATGPHVCYRFWKNGTQIDPLTQKRINSEPMNPKYKPRFLEYMTPLKIELDSIAGIKLKV